MNVLDILAPWETVNTSLGLSGPIRDEAHYTALLAFVDEAFERFGGDEAHPVFSLVSLVADRLREYKARIHPWPDTATPATVLQVLMDEHGLSQKDLPEVGTQSVISDVLAGKRKINLRQAKALAQRFSLPMDVFAG